MNTKENTVVNSTVYYRLIALWILNEAMLGGIIHGLKIPVSGLVVGSCAVICICLIAWYVPQRGAIIKATIIVAIFKMMLSPQAPPPAYIAVFFQGLLGELLFIKRRLYSLSCFLLAILALVESAVQRIFVLMITYGDDLWKAIDGFISKQTGQKEITNYSRMIASGYVLLHFIVGVAIGWLASILPRRIDTWSKNPENRIIVTGSKDIRLPEGKRRKKKWLKKGLLIVWIILIGLLIKSELKIGTPWLPSHISVRILVRSLIIVLTWYFLIGPLLNYWLQQWLKKRKSRSQQEVQEVLQLLPATQQLVAQSWERSSGKRGWRRVSTTGKLILVNALTTGRKKQLFILSAPVQTGKTTSLIAWSEKRDDVSGILTPVVNGKKMFMDLQTRDLFPMEAGEEDKDTIAIGRFVFSRSSFAKAEKIIRDAMNNNGWLVIDEIGPLELKGEGFGELLRDVLLNQPEGQTVLLVIREGLVEKLKEYFKINHARVIQNTSSLPQ